jgi:hypothetical protein
MEGHFRQCLHLPGTWRKYRQGHSHNRPATRAAVIIAIPHTFDIDLLGIHCYSSFPPCPGTTAGFPAPRGKKRHRLWSTGPAEQKIFAPEGASDGETGNRTQNLLHLTGTV